VGNYAAFPLGENGSDAQIAVELTKDFNLATILTKELSY
jgi:hypothetical protein